MSEIRTGQRLIFADGSEYENATAGYADGVLVLFMRTSITLQQAAALVFDPQKTERIVFEYGEMEDTYENFTNVVNLSKDSDENVIISLRRA